MIIHQAYGSEKDISVYTAINLKPTQIFIIGKVSKRHQILATILYDGYAAHLSTLQAHGGSRPAQGNARMVIPRGQFGLPGQNASLRRRRWVFLNQCILGSTVIINLSCFVRGLNIIITGLCYCNTVRYIGSIIIVHLLCSGVSCITGYGHPH